MQTKELNLENSIEVLEPVIEKYVFSMPFKGERAREVYREVKGRIEKDFKNTPVFDGYFEFNEQTEEINGSDTYPGILINEVLNQERLWIPTFVQAKILDKNGPLFRDSQFLKFYLLLQGYREHF